MKSMFKIGLGVLLSLTWGIQRVAAGDFDSIPTGARGSGMGFAYTAVADDPTSSYWNPAGLQGLKRGTFSISHLDIASLGLISYDYLVYAQPFVLNNAVAISWRRLGTSSQVYFMNYTENTFVLSFQQLIIPELSLGLNVKVMQIQYLNSASGIGGDLGLRYQPSPDFALAVIGENINHPEIYWTSGYYERLPINLRAGVAFYLDANSVFSLDGDRLLETDQELRFGGEYRIFENLLALRAGVRYPLDKDLFYPTGGLGFHLGFLEVNYAYVYHPDLDANHSIGLNWTF